MECPSLRPIIELEVTDIPQSEENIRKSDNQYDQYEENGHRVHSPKHPNTTRRDYYSDCSHSNSGSPCSYNNQSNNANRNSSQERYDNQYRNRCSQRYDQNDCGYVEKRQYNLSFCYSLSGFYRCEYGNRGSYRLQHNWNGRDTCNENMYRHDYNNRNNNTRGYNRGNNSGNKHGYYQYRGRYNNYGNRSQSNSHDQYSYHMSNTTDIPPLSDPSSFVMRDGVMFAKKNELNTDFQEA